MTSKVYKNIYGDKIMFRSLVLLPGDTVEVNELSKASLVSEVDKHYSTGKLELVTDKPKSKPKRKSKPKPKPVPEVVEAVIEIEKVQEEKPEENILDMLNEKEVD